jgi:hypothetical protein
MMDEVMLEHVYLEIIPSLFNTPLSQPHVVRDCFKQAAHYHVAGLYVGVFISDLELGCRQNKISYLKTFEYSY